MSSKRFEVSISPDRREALDALARELGCSSSDLVRLGVNWILAHRQMLVAGPPVLARPTDSERAVGA
jgi:hypothetical protein